MTEPELPELPPWAFGKRDPSPDPLFYASPRLVAHIDAVAIAALTDLYRAVLPQGGAILDLMSSWISHLPDAVAYRAVVGHGLSGPELAANPRLTRHFVQDLNADPVLPLETGSLDAATLCVGVQYLQRPLAVLAEVARVLRPGAPIVVSVSNRCFPTKAVAIWTALAPPDRTRLVELYLRRGGFSDIAMHTLVPEGGPTDPLTAIVGRAPGMVQDGTVAEPAA